MGAAFLSMRAAQHVKKIPDHAPRGTLSMKIKVSNDFAESLNRARRQYKLRRKEGLRLGFEVLLEILDDDSHGVVSVCNIEVILCLPTLDTLGVRGSVPCKAVEMSVCREKPFLK